MRRSCPRIRGPSLRIASASSAPSQARSKDDPQAARGCMKASPKVGTTGEHRFVVEPKHAIDFADGQMPAVLSTPWLIWFLEHAARQAVLPFLESGESTVGTHVEVQHLAPTPLGETVSCQAR